MSFDALAPHYRWMEWLLAGNKLQRSRTAFLDRVADAQNVLIAGEGNGRFLLECRRRLPSARVTVLDASGGMIAAARRRVRAAGLDLRPIEFVQGDVLSWKPRAGAHDLVVTHFFLDCFTEPQVERVVGAPRRGAGRGATWLLADFQVPASGTARLRARAIHALMYGFFDGPPAAATADATG